MATDIEKLVVQMSAEFRDFNKQFAAANGVATKQFNAIQKKAWETDKVLNSIGKEMARGLVMPITGIGAALGVRELIRLTDTWTDLNSRVKIATGSTEAGTETMGRLGDMARRTYSSLETTAESFLTNSQALKELGYNTSQQLDFTEALNNALVVSGAKGQRAEQVINALGKAMAFGQLRGENLNTVIQTGGRVAQALADGLGITTNELRKLGEAGKITSGDVFKALTSQMETLRKEADGMQATIGDAIQLLQNSFLEYVGGADQAAGASARIAESIILVADNLDTVASAALTAATAIIGALAGRAMLRAGLQVFTVGKALKDFILIARSAQGLAGLGAAFSSLGTAAGPIGLIVGGTAALAVAHFASAAANAEARTDRYNEMLKRLGVVAKEAAAGVNEAADAQERLSTARGIAEFQQDTDDANQKLAEFTGQMNDALIPLEFLAGHGNEGAQAIVRLADAFRSGDLSADALARALDGVAKTQPEWAEQIASLQALITEIKNATLALGALADEQDRAASTTKSRFSFPKPNDSIVAGEKYLAEQTRRNQLTREQRDLEDEIARIRKDMPEGAFLGDTQVARLARQNLDAKAADKKSTSKQSPREKYDEAVASVRQRLDDMKEEIALQATLNPLVNDYGYATEKLRIQQELRNAATKAGLTLDPEQSAAIDDLAGKMADATVEAARLAEAQDKARQTMEDWFATGRSIARGFIDDLIEGKTAAEALGNAFSQLGSKLLDLGLNSLFGTGSGNNPFGLIGQAMGYAGGGYTGPGPRNQPAGVVHKGEVVWSQSDVAKAGGPGVVDAMRRGVAGYANGGFVMPPMPRLPTAAQVARVAASSVASSAAPQFTFAPQVDARGADAAAVGRLEQVLAKQQVEFEGRVKRIVQRRPKEGW